jgi:hypothetical protein
MAKSKSVVKRKRCPPGTRRANVNCMKITGKKKSTGKKKVASKKKSTTGKKKTASKKKSNGKKKTASKKKSTTGKMKKSTKKSTKKSGYSVDSVGKDHRRDLLKAHIEANDLNPADIDRLDALFDFFGWDVKDHLSASQVQKIRNLL